MEHFRRPILEYCKEKRIKKNQAGGFVTWFFVIIILLAFAIVFLVLNKAWGDIKTPLSSGLNESVPVGDREEINTVLNQTGDSTLLFDKLLPFLLIGLFAFVLILAGSIMKHPIMIFVGVIVLGVVILIAVIYSNLYKNIAETDEFTDTNEDMPIQSKFMQYLPIIAIIAAIGVVASILWRDKGGGNY